MYVCTDIDVYIQTRTHKETVKAGFTVMENYHSNPISFSQRANRANYLFKITVWIGNMAFA